MVNFFQGGKRPTLGSSWKSLLPSPILMYSFVWSPFEATNCFLPEIRFLSLCPNTLRPYSWICFCISPERNPILLSPIASVLSINSLPKPSQRNHLTRLQTSIASQSTVLEGINFFSLTFLYTTAFRVAGSFCSFFSEKIQENQCPEAAQHNPGGI